MNLGHEYLAMDVNGLHHAGVLIMLPLICLVVRFW